MKRENLHWKIGDNIGKLLLEIAQEKIVAGDMEGAIELYLSSFIGISRELALDILKGKVSIVVNHEHNGISLIEDVDKSNYYDWKWIAKSKLNNLFELAIRINKDAQLLISDNGSLNFDFSELLGHSDFMLAYSFSMIYDSLGTEKHIDPEILSNFEELSQIGYEINDNNIGLVEQLLRIIYNYTTGIDRLFKDLKNYELMMSKLVIYKFLRFEDISFYTYHISLVYEKILEYANDFTISLMGGKIKPLNQLQIDIKNYSSYFFSEYKDNKILLGEIEDGYDAGYLSPDGSFYGMNGAEQSLLHLQISELLFKGEKYNQEMKKCGVVELGAGSLSPERYLESRGWIKVHHQEVYGYFRWNKDPYPNDYQPYCPTKVQLEKLDNYAKKLYNGKLIINNKEIKTSSLLQMDEIMLHETFNI